MKTITKLAAITLAAAISLSGSMLAAPVGLKLAMTSGGGLLNNTNVAYLNANDLAGAAGFPQTNWNNMGRYGDGINPVDEYGTNSGLTVSWDSNGSWSQVGGGTPTAQTLPDNKLMNSYADSSGTANTIAKDGSIVTGVGGYSSSGNNKPWVYIRGLNAWLAGQGACSYDIVVYSDGDATSGRVGQYWVENATGAWTSMTIGPNLTGFIFVKDTANFLGTGGTGTYVEVPASSNTGAGAFAGNYCVFPGLSADSVLLRSDKYNTRSPINAVQIIPHTIELPAFPYPLPPTPQTNYGGATASFFVPASGCGLTYQWQAGAIGSGVFTNVVDGGNQWGSTTPNLTITNLALSQTADYVLKVSNTAGPTTTTPITLVVQPAVITGPMQPGEILYPGGTAHFNTTASGTGTLTYQWYKGSTPLTDGGNISGSTTTNLVISNVSSADAASYTLVVTTTAFGTQSSVPSSLTVLPPVTPGSFAESVMTNKALAYWRLGENSGATVAYDYAGGLNGTYGINSMPQQPGPVPPDFAGFESLNTCVGVNPTATAVDQSWVTIPALNLNTNTATFVAWVNLAALQQNWAGILTCRHGGTQAGFNFSDTKNELVYTWNNNTTYSYHSGLIVSNNTWSLVALVVSPTNAMFYCGDTNGLRSAVITLSNKVEVFSGIATIGEDDTQGSGRAMFGYIDEVAVFQHSLSPTDIAWLYVAGRSAGVAQAATITQQPLPQNIYPGRAGTFSVVASGLPPFTYQWRKGGNVLSDTGNISGSGTAALTVGNVQAGDLANYDVIVYNPGGSVTSSPAPLAMTAPTGAAYEAAVMAAAPLAYWRLGETLGNVYAFDYFGGHTATYGTYSQGAGQGYPGPISPDWSGFEAANTGLNLTPNTDQSWVAVPPLNLNANTVTMTAWINPQFDQQTNGVGLVFQRQGLTVAGLAYSVANANHLGYNWNNAAATYNWDSGLAVPYGQWSLAALVVEPTRATVYLYNTNSQSVAVNVLAHPVQPFAGITYLGTDPFYANGVRTFNGTIDEVALWNRALSGDQIAALFTAASGKQIPVSIVMQPTPLTIYSNKNAQFAVTTAGSGPLSYQWYKDGTAITDAGNLFGSGTATLNATNATYTNGGNYYIVVTNSFSSATSVVARLTVLNPSAQPVFSAPAAISVSSLTNQSGVVVGAATFGATERIVSVTNATTIFSYDFKADGSVASTTGNGTGTGAFTTNTTGNANLDLVLGQYNYDGGPKNITIKNLIPGHQYTVQLISLDDRDTSGGQHREQSRRAYFQDPYNLTNVSTTFYMSNNYYVKASFTAASTTQLLLEQLPGAPDGFTDVGTGNLEALVLRDATAVPTILPQPRSISRYAGHDATFTASVYGPPPVYYQWQEGSGGVFTNLPASGVITVPFSASVNLIKPGVTTADAVDYRLIATNSSGSVTSQVATLTVLTPPAGSYAQAVLSYGPLAYWQLDETAGSPIANDFVGGFDGTYGAFATNGVPGVPNPPFPGFQPGELAVQTSGGVTQSWVTVPGLNLNTNTVTFTAWVHPNGVQSNWAGIFMTRTGTAAGIGYNDQGMLGYTWNNNSTWSFVSSNYIPINQWSFVAVAIDPNNAALYVINQNGLQTTNNAIAHQNEVWANNANIGNDPNDATANRTFNGVVDDVAVFKRTLAPTEIMSLYSAIAVPPPAAPTGLTTTAGDARVTLSWNSVVGAVSYNLKRSTVSGGPYTTIATGVTSLTYTNTGLVNGTLYYYVVAGVTSGEGALSAEASARPVSLTKPQLGFTAGGGQIHVTWPADHTGWRLLYQTNAPGAGLSSTWQTWTGSDTVNSVAIPIDPTQGSAFFRLVYP